MNNSNIKSKSPPPKYTGTANKLYGIATGFFSLKTVQDQESVIKCLKAFRNFKISKSPDAYRKQYDDDSSMQENTKNEEDPNGFMVKFDPMQFINPDEENNLRAIQNLGLNREQFYQVIHIQDFYSIKESREMQIHRYFTKVSEVQQKIQAVILERKRMEGEFIQRKREKQLVAQNILRNNNQSPLRGHGSSEEGKYAKLLRNNKKHFKREIQLQAKQFKMNHEKQNKYDLLNQQFLKNSQQQHDQDILKKQEKAKARNQYHDQRTAIIREEQKEREQERIETNEELKKEQIEFINDNEEKKRVRERKQYEKDQEIFQLRSDYYRNKVERENLEFEQLDKLNQEINQKLERVERRKLQLTNEKQQNYKNQQTNLHSYRQIHNEKQFEKEQDLINTTYSKLQREKVTLEKLDDKKNLEVKKFIIKNKKRMDTSEDRFQQKKYEYEEYLENNQKEMDSKQQTSANLRQQLLHEKSQDINDNIKNRQQYQYFNLLQQKQEQEAKKDQILEKELNRRIIFDKESSEYQNFIKKKLKLRIQQKKDIEELNQIFHGKQNKALINQTLRRLEIQDDPVNTAESENFISNGNNKNANMNDNTESFQD